MSGRCLSPMWDWANSWGWHRSSWPIPKANNSFVGVWDKSPSHNLNFNTNIGSMKKRYIISNRPCLHTKKKKKKKKTIGYYLTTRDERRFLSRGRPEISKKKKKIQIRIHIVLINYQPRQIPKNHCFLIYQNQLFEIVVERYGYFPELGYWHFLEWIFSRIGTSTFFGIGIAILVVGNPMLTLEEFEYFLLKKIKHCNWFFHDLQIK